MRRLFALLAALIWASAALAQVPTQQTASRPDAATNVGFTQAAVGSSSVVTITPPGGQYVYLTSVSFDVCQNGTATAIANGNVTSSGIVGAPSWSFSSAATANICAVGVAGTGPASFVYPATTLAEKFPVPLRSSSPGTAVVLTSPTTANVQYTIRAAYYFAP